MRDADELMLPAVRETVAALDPPAADAALVRLAETLARSVDHMPPAVADAMLAQVSGQLLRVLKELDDRARARRVPARGGSAKPGKVAQLRSAHVQATRKRAG